jgi:hypothetical protein
VAFQRAVGNFRCVLSAKFYGPNLKYSSHRLCESCLDKLACQAVYIFAAACCSRNYFGALVCALRKLNENGDARRCVAAQGFGTRYFLSPSAQPAAHKSEFGLAKGDQLVCFNFHLIILTRLRFLAWPGCSFHIPMVAH